MISSYALVRYGLNPCQKHTYLCRNSGKHKLNYDSRGSRSVSDDNGIRYTVTASLDLKWYKKCKCPEFWDYTDERRQDMSITEKNDCGLSASTEWRDLRGTGNLFAVVAFQRARVTGRVSTSSPSTLKYCGNVYAIIKSRQQLISLYKLLPPADRFLQEVIFPNTPHKCVMDIEREFDDALLTDEEMEAEMKFMQDGLRTMFIPKLCSFFTNKLGIAVTSDNCYVTDSSKHGLKFSVHLVVTTHQKHYFKSRMDSWIAMALFAQYLEKYSDLCPEFKKWFFYYDPKQRLRTTWDFAIYGKGTRNMRMIGACKANGQKVSRKWTDCRVFVPIEQQECACFTNFVSSLYDTTDATQIVLSDDVLIQTRDYVLDKRKEGVGCRFWFQNSVGLAGIMMQCGMVPRVNGMSTSVSDTLSNTSSYPSTLAPLYTTNHHFSRLMREIKDLGRENGTYFHNDFEEYNLEVFGKFKRYVKDCLAHIVGIVHPGNHIPLIDPEFNPTAGYIAKVRVNCKIPGITVPRRLCHFGCTNGHHQAEFVMMADLSVTYHCWGCRTKMTIVDTPIRPNGIPPYISKTPCPTDFLGGFIDYSVEPPRFDAGEDDHHMRLIRPLNGINRYLPDGNTRRTIIGQGPMGSGKTVMCKRFLEHVRNEKPDARIIAFSFRRMLAAMFAKSFDLTLYTDVDNYSLYDIDQIAIQLESLERLGCDVEDEGVRKKFKIRYDVVIIDEIESILSHFGSSTMRDRLNTIWRLFIAIVKRCSCLLVCDADIGPRTFSFLRALRAKRVRSIVADADDVRRRVPNLEYHYNSYVAIRTKFFDYIGEAEWYNQLLSYLVAGRNIFYFSNNKKHMRAIKCMLVGDLHALHDKRVRELIHEDSNADLDADHKIRMLTETITGITIIDADVTEKQKKAMTNCNSLWTKFKMVMISPTVGAGIDFTALHFHAAFGYGTSRSCSARGLNQMRGRVRQLIMHECHMYIADNADLGLEKVIRDIHIQEHINPPNEEDNINDAYIEIREHEDENEFDENTDRDQVLTLVGAINQLRQSRVYYLSDALQMDIVNNEFLFTTAATIDDLLENILAFNTIERNRSQQCFRIEFIKILQIGDPDVDYRFVSKFNYGLNKSHRIDLMNLMKKDDAGILAMIAKQDEVSRDTFLLYQRNDRSGGNPTTTGGVAVSSSEHSVDCAMNPNVSSQDLPSSTTDDDNNNNNNESIPGVATEQQSSAIEMTSMLPPNSVSNEKEMAAFLKKNKTKLFYNLRTSMPTDLWEQLLRIGGGDDMMDKVRNFTYILGTDTTTLYNHAMGSGTLRDMEIVIEDIDNNNNNNGDADNNVNNDEVIRIKQRTAQEIWPSNMMIRFWANTLLYACGFMISHPREYDNDSNPLDILPGIGCGSGHSAISEQRLRDNDIQEWLNRRAPFIMRNLHIRQSMGRNIPKPGDQWENKHVKQLTKQMFINCFNLDIKMCSYKRNSKRRKRKRPTDTSLASVDGESLASSSNGSAVLSKGAYDDSILSVCEVISDKGEEPFFSERNCPKKAHVHGENVTGCGRLFHVADSSLAVMLSLSYLYLANTPRNESEIRVKARDQILRAITIWNRYPLFRDNLDDIAKEFMDTKLNELLGNGGEDEPTNNDRGDDDSDKENDMNALNIPEEILHLEREVEEMRVQHENMNTQNALEQIKTVSEQLWGQKMAMLCNSDNDDRKREEKEMYNKEIITRYTGDNLYTKSGVVFASRLVSKEYKYRYKRILDRLKRDVLERRTRFLDGIKYPF